MRPVVGGVHNNRVVGNPKLVQLVEQRAHDFVVINHRVVVRGLPAPGLAEAFRLRVSHEVHVCGVEPDKERRTRSMLAIDEVEPMLQHLVVDSLHALLRQRSGVLDPLPADSTPARLVSRIVFIGRPAVQHSARPESVPEVWEVLWRRIVRRLGILLGIQVVEIAEELVEAVGRREELIPVAEMVLPELAGRVSERLQQLRDRRILGLQTGRRRGYADLAQAGTENALAGDE